MAITQALCTSFLKELMEAKHDLTADTLKLALYTSTATLSASTSAYTATNEVASGGGYTTGGETVTISTNPTTSGTTAYIDISDVPWAAATFTCRGAILYNTSAPSGNEAIAVLDFGSDKSPSAETLTVQMPTADSTNAIIRITGG